MQTNWQLALAKTAALLAESQLIGKRSLQHLLVLGPW
jgi:hypothetical protein